MIRIWVLVLLAGCNSLLGLDPTHEPDAFIKPDAVGCSGSRFAGTITVPIDGDPAIYDPTQSDDPDELYFTWAVTTSEFRIATATRSAPDQTLTVPALASFGRTTHDSDPAITSDGLHILFLSVDDHVYQTDRSTRQDAWSTATVVSGIDNWVLSGGLDISLDGLTIYFSDGSGLHTAKRTEITGAFGDVTDLAVGVPVAFPGISPDERELFYNPVNSHELHRMTRNDRSLDFDVATDDTLLNNAGDPDVSPDSRTLLYDVDGKLTAMHRDCL